MNAFPIAACSAAKVLCLLGLRIAAAADEEDGTPLPFVLLVTHELDGVTPEASLSDPSSVSIGEPSSSSSCCFILLASVAAAFPRLVLRRRLLLLLVVVLVPFVAPLL